MLKLPPNPNCDYCGQPAEKVTGAEVWPHRSDLAEIIVWRCVPCGAWVRCHAGGDRPLGRLANAELRAAKIRAHAAFDPLWKVKMRRDDCGKGKARAAGYRWLAGQLGIDPKLCHIGMMDVADCERVVAACSPIIQRRRA